MIVLFSYLTNTNRICLQIKCLKRKIQILFKKEILNLAVRVKQH